LEGDDPVRSAELAAMLLRNGIEVRRTNTAVAARRARSYATGSVVARRFDAGAYVVDLAQPLGRLARALLEPDPVLDSSFVRTQLDRFSRNVERARKGPREDYEFYDVTAWSLPLAFGVEAYWTEDTPAVEGDLLILPDSLPPLGEALPVVVTGGVVRGAGATTAYLFSNARQSASRLAGALLNEAFRVAVSRTPLDVAGETWPRGTFVVHVSRNAPALHARIDALAREAGVDVVGVNTAFPAAGQYSIGSETVVSLKAPKIALVGGEGVSPTGFGALWWTLEQRYRLPITTISTDALNRVDLSPFNTIVIPPAEPDELQKRLGNGAGLKKWVEDGGTLVTMEGATAWAARDSVNLTSARILRSKEDEDEKPTPPATSASDTTLGVRSPTASTDEPEPLPGSLFDVVLDRTHWLTLGLEEAQLTVLFAGSTFFRPSREGSNVAVFAPEGRLHRAGFAWPENTERLLRGTSLVVHEPLERGHVVLFANDPTFRAWWRSMDKLVLNAVLLGSGF
jgi:hypothetical protein